MLALLSQFFSNLFFLANLKPIEKGTKLKIDFNLFKIFGQKKKSDFFYGSMKEYTQVTEY